MSESLSVTMNPEPPQDPAPAPAPATSPGQTPTAAIVKTAAQVTEITDSLGRKLSVQRLNALQKLRLFKAIGQNSSIDAYLGMAVLVASVLRINGQPLSPPITERQLEANTLEVGDEGVEAVAAIFRDEANTNAQLIAQAKNSPGTPS